MLFVPTPDDADYVVGKKSVAHPTRLFSKDLPRYSKARSYAGQAGRGDTGVVSYSGSWSFHDWVPKQELGNQRIKRCKTDQVRVTGAIPLPRSVSNSNGNT